MKNSFTFAGLLFFASSSAAQAGEACRSAKDMIRMVDAFYGADADRVDIIEPSVSLKMTGINGHPTPSQMLFRDGGAEHYLEIDEAGQLQNIEKVAGLSKDAEMCRVINGEIPEPVEGDTTSANISFLFPYRRTDGEFTVEELREGAKDGSKIMDGVAPGGLGFAVPGLKAIALKRVSEDAPIPVATFTRKGEPVDVPISTFNSDQFMRLKDIKSAKADMLTIQGDYDLSAMFKFDPEDMAEAETKRLAALVEQPAE
ncbi:hypothetical protein [Litorimonas sp. WD9-15]|uniref:hypothetical protein n=1 Tax=Litorimonas sp. WD9-15 TaxID=3418716 RepID=UPI003D05C1A2